MITNERLDEIQALVDGATPAPWLLHPSKYVGGQYVASSAGETIVHATEQWAKPEDAQFIVTARTAVPEMLTEIRELRAENAEYKKFVDRQIDAKHGPGAAAAIDAAIADGSIFGDDNDSG